MRIQNTIDIDAPVSDVWQVTTDVERLPSITPTMTRVERLDGGPLAVGSQARIKQPGQRARVWTVTVLEPERRFAWSTKVMGATMTATHELAPTERGTSNTLTIDVDGALVGALVKAPARKAIARENEGFRAATERSPGLGSS